MVMESTRGHEPARPAHYKSYEDRLAAWSALLDDSDARGGGPVMVPCFAIQRAQELWFDLDMVLRTTSAGRPDTNGRPRWLSLDAPLAARMTDVYAATLVNPDPSDDRPIYRNPEIAQRLGLADEHAVDAHLSALCGYGSGATARLAARYVPCTMPR